MSADPFDDFDAKNGYHVVTVTYGSTVEVAAVTYAGGVPVRLGDDEGDEFVTLLSAYRPTPAEAAAADRLALVASAVARYLTTGGQWDEFDAAVAKLKTAAPGGLVFPGYHLTATYNTTDGYQHVFTKDGTHEAVLWEEPAANDVGGLYGGFVDRTTLEELRRQDEEEWGDVRHAETGEAGQETQEGPGVRRPTDLLQLQPHPGDGPAEAAP